MKKYFLIIVAILFVVKSYSANSDLFTYDREMVNNEFKDLSALEKYVSDNNYPTYAEINTKHGNLCFPVLDVKKNPLGSGDFDNMDWGAFAWGFCCCPIGFFVVATNKDSNSLAKKSYWTGVIISSILSLVSNLIAYSSVH